MAHVNFKHFSQLLQHHVVLCPSNMVEKVMVVISEPLQCPHVTRATVKGLKPLSAELHTKLDGLI